MRQKQSCLAELCVLFILNQAFLVDTIFRTKINHPLRILISESDLINKTITWFYFTNSPLNKTRHYHFYSAQATGYLRWQGLYQ